MKNQPRVILAHARSAAARAQEAAEELKALGFAVTPLSGRGDLNAADRLVLLWSKDAARAPALRALARRARKAGKLVCVRLDASQPPARLAVSPPRLPARRHSAPTWRRLLEQNPAVTAAVGRRPNMEQTMERSSRLSAVGVVLFSALAVGVALYMSDARFAATVKAWTQQAAAIAGAGGG